MSKIVTDPTTFPTDFESALNAGDLDGIVGLYHEDATLHVQSGEIHSGTAATRAEMAQLIGMRAHIKNTLRHTFQHNDVALIIVDYALRVTLADGREVVQEGTATNVLRHDGEKGWRMIIANPQGTAQVA